MRHVISLSTIPPRFDKIGPTLAALVRQRSRPEAVELYIPRSYRRFPQWGGGLPEVPHGVTIVRVDEDLGPATKVLPAARSWRGQGVVLLFLDDDHVAAPSWAGRHLRLRRQHPEAALCASGSTLERMGAAPNPGRRLPHGVVAPDGVEQLGFQLRRLAAVALEPLRGKPLLRPAFRRLDRSGYVDIAEGVGGVSLLPEAFDDAVWQIPPVLWTVDDVWLSGHLERRGIPIWADQSLNLVRKVGAIDATHALYRATIEGANREQANLACVNHMRQAYGIWGGMAAQST